MELTTQLPNRSLSRAFEDGSGGGSPPGPDQPGVDTSVATAPAVEAFGFEPVYWEFSGMHPGNQDSIESSGFEVDYGPILREKVAPPIVPCSMELPYLSMEADPLDALLVQGKRFMDKLAGEEDVRGQPPWDAFSSLQSYLLHSNKPFPQKSQKVQAWFRRANAPPDHPLLSQRTLSQNHFNECAARKPLTEL